MRRDIAVIKDNIATFAASDSEPFFHHWDRVAAAHRYKFAVHICDVNEIHAVQKEVKAPNCWDRNDRTTSCVLLTRRSNSLNLSGTYIVVN